MMIVVKSELSFSDTPKVSYCGNLFSGVIVDIVDGVVVSKALCSEGEVGGDYIPPFPLYDSSKLEIDGSFLEGGDEPFKFNGQLYSGVAYYFYNGECSIVKQYESGEEVSEAKYVDGRLKSLEHAEPDDSLTQDYVWDESGALKDFSLHAVGRFQMALHFESGKKLSLLTIRGDYFQEINTVKGLVLVDQFKSPEFLASVAAAPKLNMSGPNVTDGMFRDLLSNDGLKDIQQLQIYNTAITQDSFKEIIKLDSLVELYVESDILTGEDVRAFKLAHPHSYVRFNGEEVKA